MSAFYHLLATMFHKFFDRTIKGKFSILLAITTIECIFATIGVRSAAFGVLLHRHPAALTKFVCCVHIVYYLKVFQLVT
jgi:predicted signal transduction protein with EAL and GGDEF domain